MNSGTAFQIQNLLSVATRNLNDGRTAMMRDVLDVEHAGLRDSVRSTQLALEQTINAVNKLIDEIK
jgi:hypothetical protein